MISLMRASETIVATRTAGEVLVVDEAAVVETSIDDLPSRDGKAMRLRFTCRIRAADTAADRQMLAERFLQSSDATLTLLDVSRFLVDELATVARTAVIGRDAAEWLAASHDEDLLQHLLKSARAAAFRCGLEISAPASIRIESPGLDRERRNAESIERAKQIGKLRESLGGDTLRDGFRAELNLPTPLLCVIAGSALLRYDVSKPDTPDVLELGALGPLRSVSRVGTGLIVGARSGVFVIRENAEPIALPFDTGGNEFGFNRAVAVDGRILATHSKVGLVEWQLDASRPGKVVAGGEGARCLTDCDGSTFLYALDGRLSGTAVASNDLDGATILSIARLDDGRIVVLRDDATLQMIDLESNRPVEQKKFDGKPAALSIIEVLGMKRLLLADDSGSIQCLSPDDDEVLRFVGSGYKDVTAAAGVVAALSADRQKVTLWNACAPERVRSELYVAALRRSRVADIEFA
jgi:hypothetical protein